MWIQISEVAKPLFIFIYALYVAYKQKETGCKGLHLRPQITSLPLKETRAQNKNPGQWSPLNV